MSLSAPAPQSSWVTPRCLHRDDMIKAVSSLHCLVFVGASSTELLGYPQDPASSDTIDDMIKAVSPLHCLLFVGVSPTDQSCRPQMPGTRRHDQGCVIVTLPCLCRRQLHRAGGPPPCARIDDMARAMASLYCLVLVGASSTEQSGHRQVPGSRRHDQGCVIIALPCFVGASSTELSGHRHVPGLTT